MSAPYSYDVHLPDGTVATVAASSMQVDDSGTLGLFNDEGHMVASWIKGDWKLSAPSSEPKPAPVEQLAPELCTPIRTTLSSVMADSANGANMAAAKPNLGDQ